MSERRWTTGNLGEAEGMAHPKLGQGFLFGEAFPREKYKDFGINVRAVQPGQPTSLYHAEDAEEAFLVLGGEFLAIVDEEEITLRKWDFLHLPAGVAHVLIGAGDQTAHVLMVGGRRVDPGEGIHYPVNQTAAKHGASVNEETDSFEEAWGQAGLEPTFEPQPFPWPPS